MLQISKQNINSGTDEELEELRDKFSRDGYVHLHNFIDRPLAEELASRIDEADFIKRLVPMIDAVESCNAPQINDVLNRALSHPAVVQSISRIFTDWPLQFFIGSVVRRVPGQEHVCYWHNDASEPIERDGNRHPRAVALSLNLSSAVFDGGELEIGVLPDGVPVSQETAQNIGEEIQLENQVSVPNPGLGDALLFAISSTRFHRVSDVTGGGPRTVFVGWYYTIL